ncbi:replication initiation protein, partial [Persephonella sp.]
MGEKVQISDKTKLEKKKASMENSLIEAKYHLTLEEQRLILATLALLDSIEIAPNGFPLLKIPVKLIVEKLGLGKNYHIVKISLERLMSKPIKIETIDEDGRRQIEIYNWFAKGRYKEGKGFIEVQFHPDLKPYLLELKER